MNAAIRYIFELTLLALDTGRGVGALLGGILMDAVGSVNTFRVFGVLSFVSGLVYIATRFCFHARDKGDHH